MSASVEQSLEPIDVTVVFLEMGHPPAQHVNPPANLHIALLKTRKIPLHFYRYLMDRVGRKWHWVNALRLDDSALEARLYGDDREISVLYLDGAPAGFFEIKRHLPSRCELVFFGMMDHAIGMGLGRWFLGAAIQAAWASGPERVTVQTCTLDHPAALPLYQKMGFEPVGQRKETIRPLAMSERAAVLARP